MFGSMTLKPETRDAVDRAVAYAAIAVRSLPFPGARFHTPSFGDVMEKFQALLTNEQWRDFISNYRNEKLRRAVYSHYIKSAAWHRKRTQALEVTDGRCAICYFREATQVHHLTYERLGDERLEDLEPLCRRCHKEAHAR